LVKFLISRPIAVNMVYLALLLLGLYSFRFFPVSLLPATDIPEISIRVSAPGMSARMLQNNVTGMLVNQLRQVKHLEDIRSESQNNQAFIKLRFLPGTRVDLSFIEVNEKVDAIMPYLPRDIVRPQVIKARLTDIPVFYLSVQSGSNADMLDFSEFVRSVVKPRIEQLPTVAMADVSGIQTAEIAIIPRLDKLQQWGISLGDINQVITSNNIEISNILLRQRHYEYYVKIDNQLKSVEDIGHLQLLKNGRMFRLSEIAEISRRASREQGRFYDGNDRAIVLAIIKNSDARMQDLRAQMKELYSRFAQDYPGMQFTLFRDQTTLLEYSISNLQQSLWLGILLSVLISWLFIRRFQYALLIAANVVLALIISFLFIWLMGVSINIISLSGLILAVGMMIDNSIIVVENIHQQHQSGDEAVVQGTNKVIVPLLSSMFTTLAVFLPLVFMGGITKVLFYEQALTIAAGMLSAFLVSVTFLPVWIKRMPAKAMESSFHEISQSGVYEKWHHYFFQHKQLTVFLLLILSVLGIFMAFVVPRRMLPELSQKEAVYRVQWNENISLEENYTRYARLLEALPQQPLHASLLAGIPQFLIGQRHAVSFYDAEIYLDFENQSQFESASAAISEFLASHYPEATAEHQSAGNVFSRIFEDNRPPLQLNISPASVFQEFNAQALDSLMGELNKSLQLALVSPMEKRVLVEILPEKLVYFHVSAAELNQKLSTLFNSNEIGILRSFQQQIPIRLSQPEQDIFSLIEHNFVSNNQKELIPLKALLEVKYTRELRSILSGFSGEYIPVSLYPQANELEQYQQKIKEIFDGNTRFSYSFEGQLLDGDKILKQSGVLFLLSLVLLYIILAATFNSVKLPLIIMMEIPVNLSAVFLLLWLSGNSLNMMSVIGIIVMSGVVINDSILKVDTFNDLLKQGFSLEQAILQGGRMRLKAIVMTSLTTILAMVPMFFEGGMGVEMQMPLVLSVVGGLSLGTLVSLFGIPVLYYYLNKKQE